MLEQLRQQVCQANLELPRRGLVLYTWGQRVGHRPGEWAGGHQAFGRRV